MIGDGGADSLDDDIRTSTSGNLLQTLMNILLGTVDGVFCPQATDNGELLVVHVAGNNFGATHDGTNYCTDTHHATTDDHHRIGVNDLRTADGMKTDAHRLNECSVFNGNRADGDDFLPGYGDVSAHGTVALYAECLVVLAGVVAAVTA